MPQLFSLISSLLFFFFSVSGSASSPKGLVFLMHGCSQSDEDFNKSTSLEERLRKEGYEVAYIRNQYLNLFSCWQWYEDSSITPDSFIMKSYVGEIRSAQAQFHIPPERTYLIGFSSGAAMALNIAMCSKNLIGGIATQAGPAFGRLNNAYQALDFMKNPTDPRFQKIQGPCNPANYEGHMLIVHGEEDTVVNPKHAEIIMKDLGATAADRSHYHLKNVCIDALADVDVTIWKKNSQQLIQIMVPKLGHEWGGGDPKYKFTKKDAPSTTRAMINFLNKL